MLEEWKTAGMIVRVIITDMDINLAMLIDELDYSMKEGDDDIRLYAVILRVPDAERPVP